MDTAMDIGMDLRLEVTLDLSRIGFIGLTGDGTRRLRVVHSPRQLRALHGPEGDGESGDDETKRSDTPFAHQGALHPNARSEGKQSIARTPEQPTRDY